MLQICNTKFQNASEYFRNYYRHTLLLSLMCLRNLPDNLCMTITGTSTKNYFTAWEHTCCEMFREVMVTQKWSSHTCIFRNLSETKFWNFYTCNILLFSGLFLSTCQESPWKCLLLEYGSITVTGFLKQLRLVMSMHRQLVLYEVT